MFEDRLTKRRPSNERTQIQYWPFGRVPTATGNIGPTWAYIVTAQLPMRYGQFEYRIKHSNKNVERRATELELREI
jgi:hypothetical protein